MKNKNFNVCEKMNMSNPNNRQLISATKAAEILGIKAANGVLHHLQKGHIEGVQVPGKTRQKYMYYEDSVYRYKNIKDGKKSAYGNLDIAMEEMCKPILSLGYQSPYAPFYYPEKQYLVTSYGIVWDLSNNRKISGFRSGNGHIQVQILFRGITVQVLLHRIVAMMFCQNGKFKDVVHHIDCNKLNNRADNLIWVTIKEHRMLHSIWKKCEERNDFSEYDQAVNDIKNDNEIEVPYRFIEENVSDNGLTYLMVTEEAYKRVVNGDSIENLKPEDILMETYLIVAQALKQECPCNAQES